MFDKYETKTYPEYFQIDDSDTETEKIKSTLKSKKATYINPKRFSDDVFHPECIFTKENRNISFFQSDSRNSYKDRKYKSLNKNYDINYDSDVIRKSCSSPTNYVEEQFSYNYTNTEEKNNNINENDNNIPLNQRICLDTFLHQNSIQVPRRTIKSYQNQFDVEKSDNFNVLSYRPEDYESDYIKTDSKSKIIQIFKKEDVGELFYPSKRAQSPQSPPSSNNSSEKKGKLMSYQTPTLKFQSFFGSYTRPKNVKNNNQAKSTSKRKINQLEDFNIDKLIEIGDNFSNKFRNILSFGKKIKNIKNKFHNLNCDSENEGIVNKNKKIENSLKIENLTEIIKISPKKNVFEENIKNMNDNNKDKKIITKKIIYHGQIKRKRNIKNTKTFNIQNKEINNQNKVVEDINKNLNINITKKELSNNNINNRSNTNNSTKYKKMNSKQNSNPREFYYNKNNGNNNSMYNRISPKKTQQKKKIDINLNDNHNYSINNYQNIHSIVEKNKYITMMNRDNNNNIQNELSKKILLTEEDNNLNNNKNIIQQIKPTIKKATINSTNQEENYNKKYNKTNLINNNNQNFKKNSDKGFKSKNYYGYDERHNLEGTINNHSYYVSVCSRKKVNQKNNSIDKINN